MCPLGVNPQTSVESVLEMLSRERCVILESWHPRSRCHRRNRRIQARQRWRLPNAFSSTFENVPQSTFISDSRSSSELHGIDYHVADNVSAAVSEQMIGRYQQFPHSSYMEHLLEACLSTAEDRLLRVVSIEYRKVAFDGDGKLLRPRG